MGDKQLYCVQNIIIPVLLIKLIPNRGMMRTRFNVSDLAEFGSPLLSCSQLIHVSQHISSAWLSAFTLVNIQKKCCLPLYNFNSYLATSQSQTAAQDSFAQRLLLHAQKTFNNGKRIKRLQSSLGEQRIASKSLTSLLGFTFQGLMY